jgi:acyl-CoA thioester hydrolase
MLVNPKPQRLPPEQIGAYGFIASTETRWADNDLYGHVNNAVYYQLFDSAVNRFLIEQGGLDIHSGAVIGLVVESSCRYHAPVAYPERIRVGVRVDRLGSSSVTYGVALFSESDPSARADGTFTHVFVDRTSRRPAPMPEPLRAALQGLSR